MNEKKKILIIEDHDSIRILLGNFLSKKFNVFTKEDGFDALLWLGNGNIPDFIILDLDMPRMGGLEFLKNIRGSGFYRDIPVIVVSGEESLTLLNQCKAFDIVDFYSKPFNPLKLKQQIEATLQQKTEGKKERLAS